MFMHACVCFGLAYGGLVWCNPIAPIERYRFCNIIFYGQEVNKMKAKGGKFYYDIPKLYIFSFLCIFNQADVETDEVYAEMTLQPVNKVGSPFNFIFIKKLALFFFLDT